MRLSGWTFLLISTAFLSNLNAQRIYRGYVVDETNEEPVVGVEVAGAGISTISNLEGYFNLELPASHRVDTLVFKAFSYADDTLFMSKNTDLIRLKLQPFVLETIVISSLNSARSQVISPTLAQLSATPVILGQTDILKSLTAYPGIASGQEGLTAIHVRGGDADQNLILLDGSTIYNPGHLFGFLSVFNPDVIRHIDVHKSYIPSRFGGRLSSVVDVQSKTGSSSHTAHTKEVGLLSLGYTVSGPLRDSSWTILAGGRLAHSGVLTLGSLPGYVAAKSPLLLSGMYDLNLKLSKSYASGRRLIFSTYIGDDFFGGLARSKDDGNYSSYLRYGNRTLSLRYFAPIWKKWYHESLINFNRYASGYNVTEDLRHRDTSEITRYANTGHISEFTVRQSIAGDISSSVAVTLGVEAQYRYTEPVKLSLFQNGETFVPDRFILASTGLAPFADIQMRISRRVSSDLGLRYSIYHVAEERYTFAGLEPRIALNYLATSDLELSLQYNRTNQPLHAINNRSGGLPITFWIPAGRQLQPQNGNSFGFSLAYIGKEDTELRLAAYTRTMKNLIELPSGEFSGTDNDDWTNNIVGSGRGKSYGLEGYYRRVLPNRNEWSISYTLSRSERRFAEINEGRVYPYDFDRPHDLFIQINKYLSPKWSLIGAFTYQTGRPVNVAQAVGPAVFGAGDVTFFSTIKNNGRFPDYHRLDLVFVKKIVTKRQRNGELKLGLYNLYGKVNPIDLNYSLQGSTNRAEGLVRYTPVYRSEALFRFFPIISHTVNW